MVKRRKTPKRSAFIRRRERWGYAFILPWFIGTVTFFLLPLIQTIWLTLQRSTVGSAGFIHTFIGLDNYTRAFREDPDFLVNLGFAASGMLMQILVIVPFSLIVALILRGKFRGRMFFRAVFFLPVIIASGVVITVLTENVMSAPGADASQVTHMFRAPSFVDIFSRFGVPDRLLIFLEDLITNLFSLTWKSGVQILLLLAALNNIPKSSYEVAVIEGATEWEKLWKVTLPLVSPTMLVAVLYTIINSFTDYDNQVMRSITALFQRQEYAYASTIGIIYFAIVLVFIGVFNKGLGYFVVYQDR